MGWGEDRLRYTETWVYARMGDTRETDLAARRALELYPSTDNRTPVQIDLMQAFSRVRCGDLSEGIRHARSVYEALGADERTTMVDFLAKQVAAIVPNEARDRPEVAAYRELLSPPQKAIEA
jgi:hypothetical protein